MPFTPFAQSNSGAVGGFTPFTPPPRQLTDFEKKNKLATANADATKSAAESKKANSAVGFATNFGKAVVSNLAGSEVGLGKTIGKLAGNQTGNYSKLIEDTSTNQVNILREIHKLKGEGKDTKKLEGLYAEGEKQLRDLGANLAEENNLPTTGQVVGQLGGTALDVLTAGSYGKKTVGMPSFGLASGERAATKLGTKLVSPEITKVGEIAAKPTGLFTAKGAGKIAGGAGIGYAQDVTQGLQGARGEDRTGARALIPGGGTALGAAIPAISETVQTGKNLFSKETKAQNLIAKRQTELEKLDNYQTIKKQTLKGQERGIDIKKTLAETDVLHGAVDKSGTIHTLGADGAADQYRKLYVNGNENIVGEALRKEGKSIAPQMVQKKLEAVVESAGLEGRSLVKAKAAIASELEGYAMRGNQNGSIPLATLHDAKVDKYSNINFFTDAAKQKYEKAIARGLKELVEENSTSIDVKEVNKELSKHFAVLGYLEKLDGKKVDGGKLGKYFARTVGAIVGSHFGPLGAIAGAETAGGIKGNQMSKVFNGKTGAMPTQGKAITDAVNFNKSEPIQLGQSSSNSLGSRNIDQSIVNSKSIPNSVPEQTYVGQGVEDAKKIIEDIKNTQPGLSIKSIHKSIHKEDLAELRDFTDYVAGSFKPKTSQIETDARRIAVRYGIVSKKQAEDMGNKALSSAITKAGIFKNK